MTVSACFSALGAMISNFILNNYITWRDVKDNKIITKMFKNFTTSIIGIGINLIILYMIEKSTSINYILANGIAIIFATMWNYYINKCWTWKSKKNDYYMEVIKWEKMM